MVRNEIETNNQSKKSLIMNISISFAELSDYIKKHYDKQLIFSKVTDKEVRASYTQNLFFRSVQVPLDLKIEDVKADSIAITYNGGFGIDMIIAGTLSFLKAKVPELANALVSEEGHRIRIELSKLEQTSALVEAVAFKEISVSENGLIVEAMLR